MSIKSNEKAVWGKLEAKMKGLANASNPSSPLFGRIYRTALVTSLAEVKRRVFVEGRNSKGTSFGDYSEAYYKRVRLAQNNSSRRVNLELTGELRKEYKLVLNKGIYFGFDKPEGRGTYTYNVNTQEGKKRVEQENAPNAALRAEYLAEYYGEFLHLSETELNTFTKIVVDNVNEWLQ